MIDKLLTEHHLEFLSLKGGCRGSSESTLVKMSDCWKSHVVAQITELICLRKSDWLLLELFYLHMLFWVCIQSERINASYFSTSL